MSNLRSVGIKQAIGSVGICLFLSLGCVTEPEERRVLGVFDLDPAAYVGIPGPVEVPDSVPVAGSFAVRAWTVGSSGCIRAGEPELVIEGHVATVTVYDYVRIGSGNTFCPDDYLLMVHEVTVQFDVLGSALVVVIGEGLRSHVPVELSYPVVVH